MDDEDLQARVVNLEIENNTSKNRIEMDSST